MRADRAEQLHSLRRRMAEVSDRMSRGHTAPHSASDILPPEESLLPVPQLLAEQIPGGMPRGATVVATGARSLTLAVLAAVTAAGDHAAVIGQPDIGLLAAVEMGADLTRLAVVPDAGTDPVEIAAVLLDGMSLVVLGLGGRTVPAPRARAVTARARNKGCTLLVTDGDWQGASIRLQARVSAYEMTGSGPGRGRISRVRLAVNSAARRAGVRRGA